MWIHIVWGCVAVVLGTVVIVGISVGVSKYLATRRQKIGVQRRETEHGNKMAAKVEQVRRILAQAVASDVLSDKVVALRCFSDQNIMHPECGLEDIFLETIQTLKRQIAHPESSSVPERTLVAPSSASGERLMFPPPDVTMESVLQKQIRRSLDRAGQLRPKELVMEIRKLRLLCEPYQELLREFGEEFADGEVSSVLTLATETGDRETILRAVTAAHKVVLNYPSLKRRYEDYLADLKTQCGSQAGVPRSGLRSVADSSQGLKARRTG